MSTKKLKFAVVQYAKKITPVFVQNAEPSGSAGCYKVVTNCKRIVTKLLQKNCYRIVTDPGYFPDFCNKIVINRAGLRSKRAGLKI